MDPWFLTLLEREVTLPDSFFSLNAALLAVRRGRRAGLNDTTVNEHDMACVLFTIDMEFQLHSSRRCVLHLLSSVFHSSSSQGR